MRHPRDFGKGVTDRRDDGITRGQTLREAMTHLKVNFNHDYLHCYWLNAQVPSVRLDRLVQVCVLLAVSANKFNNHLVKNVNLVTIVALVARKGLLARQVSHRITCKDTLHEYRLHSPVLTREYVALASWSRIRRPTRTRASRFSEGCSSFP